MQMWRRDPKRTERWHAGKRAGMHAGNAFWPRAHTSALATTPRLRTAPAAPAEKSFMAWKGSPQQQLVGAASGLLPMASDLAQQGWRRMSRLFSAAEVEVSCCASRPVGACPGCIGAHASLPKAQMLDWPHGLVHPPRSPSSLQDEGSASSDAAGPASAASAAKPPPPLPAPAGSLELTIESLTLAGGASNGDAFVVLKCGPYWGRSRLLPIAGGLHREHHGMSSVAHSMV